MEGSARLSGAISTMCTDLEKDRRYNHLKAAVFVIDGLNLEYSYFIQGHPYGICAFCNPHENV